MNPHDWAIVWMSWLNSRPLSDSLRRIEHYRKNEPERYQEFVRDGAKIQAAWKEASKKD